MTFIFSLTSQLFLVIVINKMVASLSNLPGLGNVKQDLLQAIYSTARHPKTSEERQDSVFGRGIINPIKALEQL